MLKVDVAATSIFSVSVSTVIAFDSTTSGVGSSSSLLHAVNEAVRAIADSMLKKKYFVFIICSFVYQSLL